MAEQDLGALFKNRIEQLKETQDDNERLTLARILFSLIKENTESVSKTLQDGVVIENVDEINATLHNEFNRNIKILKSILDQAKLSAEESAKIVKAIERQNELDNQEEFQTILVKRPSEGVIVKNLRDITFPDSFNVNNLQDMELYFKDLEAVIQKTFDIKIPAPQVTVEPTPVNIPETVMPDFNLDRLEGLLKKVSDKLTKVGNNKETNPLAVRLSDGRIWIDKIVAEIGSVQTALAGFSDRIKLIGKGGKNIGDDLALPTSITAGSKDVTTAGTAVVLGSGKCKEIKISGKPANTGKIYVGGSSVASTNGMVLFAGQTETIKISSLDSVYIDADTDGEGVQFAYVT